MTDLEKQVMQKREVETAVNLRRRTRIEDAPRIEANFFGTGDTSSKSISAQLKDFDNKYKPTDLTAMFSETLTKSETKKAENEVKQTFSPAPKALPQKPARDPYATPDEEFINVTRMGGLSTDATYEVPVDTTEFNKNKFGLKLNLKGKLVVMVASVVFLCLLFLAIFNACVIGNLNGDISKLNAQITTESELVNWIQKSYDNALDEDNLLDRVEDAGFIEIPPENIIEFELLEEEAVKAAASSSNWFDAFCNFMAQLFGAN